MKDNKVRIYYLFLGIGIGLVLGIIINFVNPNVKYIGYSEGEIKQMARGLGMYELDEVFKINKVFNEEIEKSREGESENSQVSNLKEEKPIENETKTQQEKAEEEKSDSQKQYYIEFIIEEGQSSEEIINNLLKENIIDDKEEFRNLVYRRKSDRMLKYGIFYIPQGASHDAIIDILTK